MFLFNWQREITDFLEDQQISLEKSRYEENWEAYSAKVQVQRHIFCLYFRSFPWELLMSSLSVNVGNDL